MNAVKSKSMKVHGNKIVKAEKKAKKGKFTDHFGNTIYVTDSKENQERLAALEKPKKVRKKTVRKKTAKKKS